MKILFVNACVRGESRTERLCRAYLRRHAAGIEVEELRLESARLAPFDGAMLKQRDEDIAAGDFSSDRYRFAKAFAGADLVLIGAPYWDFSFPSMLKVYFEHICVNGITFYYDKGRPVSLCRGKKLVYITTAGGFVGASLREYLEELNALFGFEKVTLLKAEGLDIQGNDPEAILKEVIL